ncbi:MAG: hypothetical protein IID30_03250 [Planctomycetes bacterium]|nr:hypothetical protein [Planctomycetota bacterium]
MSTKPRQATRGARTKVLEAQLYEPVFSLPLFRDQMVSVTREVAFYRKRVDLVWLTARGDLVAVELKVRDWKRVLWQASINQLFADFSYVAVWHRALKFLDLMLLKQRGIGVIVIQENGARTVRRASRSPLLRTVHREAVLEALAPTNGAATLEAVS